MRNEIPSKNAHFLRSARSFACLAHVAGLFSMRVHGRWKQNHFAYVFGIAVAVILVLLPRSTCDRSGCVVCSGVLMRLWIFLFANACRWKRPRVRVGVCIGFVWPGKVEAPLEFGSDAIENVFALRTIGGTCEYQVRGREPEMPVLAWWMGQKLAWFSCNFVCENLFKYYFCRGSTNISGE